MLASVGRDGLLDLSVSDSRLEGDVLNTEGGTLHLAFNKGSMLTGRTQNITSMALSQAAVWEMTGNSSVSNLTNNGAIFLSPDKAGGNTLQVNGNYTASQGHLYFNTRLGGDNSLTDKLQINGSAGGTTAVAVNNMGGREKKRLMALSLFT